ncbi:dimethyl sulfoxide reductase anchor subunit family protein [Parasulfitobacter algicola]|uniref:Dimethyl sulfoxide reductase anchor subunit n=1 Tax=Parasulfitobacter algicola TaxID=2614809 RepID=A0ABX2IMI3_9RHOB|nr:DmsC/YnfH family molybdoenzyme membrane anchor subunit [Sulfitobacter algicola]NSX54106.1 dimethyl sulfoxide reductase anchor subunit [Sulfitobacter algicola]
MHPAPSIILFTVLSGLGFGLLFWLGLGFPPVTGFSAFAFFTIAYLLAIGGLISSTFHLGNPQRALKAFTQWQTSWLSREAWLSVFALTFMGLYAIGAVFFATRIAPLGWIGSALALATVYATSMIYGQLKTVPRWNQPTTPALFLMLSLAGGALLAGQVTYALILITLSGVLQGAVWYLGDTRFAKSGTTMETATGLGTIGKVTAFEPPHTGNNYLLKEMVHVVGRKHSQKLRIIAITLMAILPIILLLLPFSHTLGALAALSHLAGVLTSRWLFFAEAEHVIGLYYGKREST